MNVLYPIENPLQKQGATPLFLEMQFPPRISPYLVTAANTTWMWIDGNRSGRLRAAFRYNGKATMEKNLFETIIEKAEEEGFVWENLFSNVEAAKVYLTNQGYPDVEHFCGEQWDMDYSFLLPRNKQLFGWVTEQGEQYLGVVFDPLHALAIIHPKFVQWGK